jgi:hypothetical protein
MAQYDYGRGGLPKGFSYPLRRTELDAALDAAGITRVSEVQLRRPLAGWIFWAEYVGEGTWYAPRRGKVRLTLFGVPSTRRAQIAAWFRAEGLPTLTAWCAHLDQKGQGWSLLDHALYAEITDSGITLSRK